MDASPPFFLLLFVALALVPAAALLGAWWMRRVAARHRQAQQLEVSSTIARQQQEADALRQQLRAAESRLREVLDAIPAGVAIYDNQDRLLGFNREQGQHAPFNSEGPLLGESFERLLRRALAAGQIPDAVGREEEWLAVRMANRGAPRAALWRHAEHSRWVHACEARTPSGYLVTTRLDITPLVEKGLALERANEQLLRLSTTDGLIGIANRRQFELTMRNEWQRCARSGASLSLLVVDVDHFRHYNDRYGHLGGDECLRQVARVLGLCVKRSGELVARYGGEEFVLLLPGTDAQEARRVAQRCLREVVNARIPHDGSPVSPWLTVSIGMATLAAAPGLAPSALVDEALSALAHAKASGRARVSGPDFAPVSAPASLSGEL